MNPRKIIFLLVSPLLFLSSCEKRQLTATEFIHWYRETENGLVKNRVLGDLEFRLEYWPHQLIQLHNEESPGKNPLYEGMEYFRLHLNHKESQNTDLIRVLTESQEEYQSLVHFLSFGFQENIRMHIGKEELQCIHYHFERNYGLKPGLDIVFAFENRDPDYQYDRKIEINDRVFGAGPVHFSIDRNIIKKSQQLIIL